MTLPYDLTRFPCKRLLQIVVRLFASRIETARIGLNLEDYVQAWIGPWHILIEWRRK